VDTCIVNYTYLKYICAQIYLGAKSHDLNALLN